MQRKLLVIAVIALLSAATFSLNLAALTVSAAAPVSLTVHFLDGSNYAPVVGALATLSGGAQNISKITDVNGTVVFSGLEMGTYLVTIADVQTRPLAAPQLVQVTHDMTITILYGHTTALFTNDPAKPMVNNTVTFDASPSTSTGIISGYAWDFGDGTYATGVTASHVYSKSGYYRVTLTVSANVGASIYGQTITVLQEQPANNAIFLLIIPLLIPIIFVIFFLRRKRYYVIIQARVPPYRRHPLCPGDDTECEDCKLTPC